jgi:hypothetical protein
MPCPLHPPWFYHPNNTGWTIGILEFDYRRALGIFLFTIASRTALGPTQPPIQWVLGALSLGTKRPGREADHSHPSSADVKECVELYKLYKLWSSSLRCLLQPSATSYPLGPNIRNTLFFDLLSLCSSHRMRD